MSKKECNVDKQEWTSPVCKRVWKRVKQIGMFIEYSHCASIESGIHFIHDNRKVTLFANENMFLITKKRIDELFQIILLKKFFLVGTLDTWYS